MEVFELKILSLAVIFVCGMIGGLLPLRLAGGEGSARFLSLGNGFAGGIFLGAGLIHMLGDAQESFAQFAYEYPLAPLIAGAGFLFVLFLEMVALAGREDVGRMSGGKGSFYPFLLTVVLSVHSLIAGAALGLEGSIAASFALLIAIVAHKGSAAFALGVSLKQGGFEGRRYIAIVSFFCCMTPIGVVAGVMFSRTLAGDAAVMAEAVFDALAAGTFVYVAVLDIIDEAFAEKVDLGLKYALLTAGFVGMALLAVWT